MGLGSRRPRVLAYVGGLAAAAVLVVGLVVAGSQGVPTGSTSPSVGDAGSLRTVTLTTSLIGTKV